jgi:hypothetical protein
MAVSNFEELFQHIGHKVECVFYGEDDNPRNVAIECIDCNEVLFEFDREEEEIDDADLVRSMFTLNKEEPDGEQDVHPDETGADNSKQGPDGEVRGGSPQHPDS